MAGAGGRFSGTFSAPARYARTYARSPGKNGPPFGSRPPPRSVGRNAPPSWVNSIVIILTARGKGSRPLAAPALDDILGRRSPPASPPLRLLATLPLYFRRPPPPPPRVPRRTAAVPCAAIRPAGGGFGSRVGSAAALPLNRNRNRNYDGKGETTRPCRPILGHAFVCFMP